MPKVTHKCVKFTPEEMVYELPKKIDVTKLRRFGKGDEAVKRLAEQSKRRADSDREAF